MARLIDAERIVYSWTIDNDGEQHDGVTLQSIIDKLPTVDAVPVVRCKDCRFHEHEEVGMVWCPNVVGSWMAEDGFCSMGERREDEIRMDS